MSGFGLDRVFALLERGLDFAAQRQELLASNIANVETPGYKRRDLDFESLLKGLEEQDNRIGLARTSPRHLSGSVKNEEGFPVKEESITIRDDGSSVDVEREMVTLLENGLYYQVLSKLTSGKFRLLYTVLKEVR
ncbi:MAG: flagellar basal body rod protein FlgB [Candidatus Atribacteria bacterium]|nr:flagellar basal body rod protein FlgB [Candidatus Atribacteria bacterium]MCD6350241.1 flagellar basal body rod protein FlgB [Candidatus Atribacteria bacterium]